MPLDQILGMARPAVETLFSPVGKVGSDDWVWYSSSLSVKYESGIAVSMRIAVNDQIARLDCEEIALWLGFYHATAGPRDDGRTCSWPEGSLT